MVAASFSIITVTSLMVAVAAETQCGGLQNNTSNDTLSLEVQNRSGVCVPISDAKDLIDKSCSKFLQNRCSIFHRNEDNRTAFVVNSVIRAINGLVDDKSDTDTGSWCGDVLLGVICNSMHLGCDPTTNLPIGLCPSTCLEYSTSGNCLPFFTEVNKILNQTEDDISLSVYTNCIPSNSFLGGANKSTNTICYEVLTGIEAHPKATTEVVTTTEEVGGTERGGEGMRDIALAYVLPSVCAVLGTAVVAVLLLAGCYLQKLRKRNRCIGVTVAGDSYTGTNAFPQLLGVREIYSNRYTVPGITSEDGSHEIEQSILPVTTSTTATSSGASNVTEDSAVFQLDLADWAAVGEGVLIPFERLTITGHLGEGAFGYVLKGLLKEVHANGQDYHMPIAMKTLKNCASYAEMRGLLVESSLMHSFSHPHILSLRGLCLNPKSGAPYLVMPFMENGDLRKFLRKKADLTDGSASATTYPQGLTHHLLARMCCDVAKGMEYLAEKRLVHRDLAARNCMVDRNLRVKVADFGLTREIYEQDCYRQSTHGQLPIKWMSPESLAYRMSNEKTDVWSFGVTCWEVFSLGKVPYPTIDNRDLLDYLDCGRRLSKPRLCNQHVYDVMQLCWKMQPEERPKFSHIVTLLLSTPTDDPSDSNRPSRTSCSNTTPQPSLRSVMKRSVTVPITKDEMEEGPPSERNGDEEYVEMTCNGASNDGVLIVANGSVAGANGGEASNPAYLNVTMSDEVGKTTETPNIREMADRQSLILSNHSATTAPPLSSSPAEGENCPSNQKESAHTTDLLKKNAPTEVGEDEDASNERGLLDSIISYFQEKSTSGSQESLLDETTDTDFLAVQMKEIETTYRSRSVTTPSRMTSSLHHNHTHSPRRQSTTERASSKFTPLVESADEMPSSPYQKISIYDECPTTPNVTISFKTGECITPADTIFNFTSKTSGGVGSRQHTKDGAKSGRQRPTSETTRVEVGERGRIGGSRGSVASMPGGRSVETGGGWREKMRERFFSYSAGDYVKMHPAPHRH